MSQCMNAVADKVHKQEVQYAHSDMHMHTVATLFNNHPYISSSKLSANWHAIDKLLYARISSPVIISP